MNGIYNYIQIIFLIFNMLSIAGYVLREATPEEFEIASGNPEVLASFTNDESNKQNNFPEKVERLMGLLRKHQNDEDELKVQIRRLLTGFHFPQNRDAPPPFTQICKCRRRSVKDVLNMLNLSPNQNELLEKIVSMMQGRPCRHASDKRKTNEMREGATINVYTTATEKININAPSVNKGYGDDTELDQNQLENIAYEVVKIIKRTPRLHDQLYRNDIGKFALPDGDTPPSEPTAANA